MTSLNKVYSSKQEKMVADYMGWKVVTGSGSRPFRPGDIDSYNILVECKTHTEEQNNIVFYKKHWIKISEEAQSKHKYPILVVDNGTQLAKNTWVMLPKRLLTDDSSLFRIFGLVNTARSDSTVTFNHSVATALYKSGYTENKINYFPEWCNGEQVAIMPLNEFKVFCKDEFGE